MIQDYIIVLMLQVPFSHFACYNLTDVCFAQFTPKTAKDWNTTWGLVGGGDPQK